MRWGDMSCCCESYHNYICQECKERVDSDRKEREDAAHRKEASNKPEHGKLYTIHDVRSFLAKDSTLLFYSDNDGNMLKIRARAGDYPSEVGSCDLIVEYKSEMTTHWNPCEQTPANKWRLPRKHVKPKKPPTTFSIEVRLASGYCDVIHDVASCKMKH
jgi:hypothetical protein